VAEWFKSTGRRSAGSIVDFAIVRAARRTSRQRGASHSRWFHGGARSNHAAFRGFAAIAFCALDSRFRNQNRQSEKCTASEDRSRFPRRKLRNRLCHYSRVYLAQLRKSSWEIRRLFSSTVPAKTHSFLAARHRRGRKSRRAWRFLERQRIDHCRCYLTRSRQSWRSHVARGEIDIRSDGHHDRRQQRGFFQLSTPCPATAVINFPN